MQNTDAPIIIWVRQDLRLAALGAFTPAAADGALLAAYVEDDEAPNRRRTSELADLVDAAIKAPCAAGVTAAYYPAPIITRGAARERPLDALAQVRA